VPAAGPGPGAPNAPGGAFAGAGSTCGANGPGAVDGAINGPSRATAQAGPGRGAPPDAATQLARSSLPDLKKTNVRLLFASAELDPGVHGSMSAFYQTLHDELCKLGPEHCPTMLFEKGESHMSEVFSIDTDDKTVSGPVLAWMKKVK